MIVALRSLALAAGLMLAGCLGGDATAPVDRLDPVAERFVKLSLQIGEKEAGYIDAYHGPPEWAAEAKAAPLPLPEIERNAAALYADLVELRVAQLAPDERRRLEYLFAHVRAARFRLRMIGGHRAAFADEADALFGVRPVIRPLTSFEPALARIETLAPGRGPLAERVAAFRKRYEIPPARLRPVIEAAIAECRRRTLAHIPLPANERFTLAFVTGKPWGGYNWFEGDAMSRIEINTDLPVTIDRALDLGCHEGYPGHHVHNILMEKLYREGGWVEFSVWPLFAPIGFIAEGAANAGVALAFPGAERRAFEQQVLYPLAGLDPGTARAYDALREALAALRLAEYAVADDYLAGRIDPAEAARRLERAQLLAPERAAKRLDFIDAYRSYIVNYGLGEETVTAYLERQPPAMRWAAFAGILSEPTLPADLGAR